MIVIAKKAEEKLLAELRRLYAERSPQRCFHLEFSKADLDKRELFDGFLKLLNDIPNSYLAQVYICQDRDVFIFMQGFMQRHFTDFIHNLAKVLKYEKLVDLTEVFEVRRDFPKLEDVCLDKIGDYSQSKAEQLEANRQKLAEKVTLEILKGLDIGLVNSIQERRMKRTDVLVMVADDDQLCRTLVYNVLNHDFTMAFARNGQEAMQSYVEQAPDVLFLDIGMPDINGHDILECLCQVDPEGYVIMFSGRTDKDNMLRALRAGAHGFVGKPFTRDKLFHYIHKSPFYLAKQANKDKQKTVVL